MRSAWKVFAALLVHHLFVVQEGGAVQCTSVKPGPPFLGESIGLLYDRGITQWEVDAAVEYWKACPRYGHDFPELVVGGPGTRVIHVEYEGRNITSSRCGSFNGVTVTIYRFAVTPNGRRISCGSVAQNLAHELGHVLGLRHPTGGLTCSDNIMARINGINARGRSVSAEECRAVGQKWLTFFEQEEARAASTRSSQ